MNLQNCQIIAGSFFQQRYETLCRPGNPIRRADFAFIVRNRNDGPDGKAMIGITPASAAECDRHRFESVAGEQVVLELRVVSLSKPELDSHLLIPLALFPASHLLAADAFRYCRYRAAIPQVSDGATIADTVSRQAGGASVP
jgi:hypothetical protein